MLVIRNETCFIIYVYIIFGYVDNGFLILKTQKTQNLKIQITLRYEYFSELICRRKLFGHF